MILRLTKGAHNHLGRTIRPGDTFEGSPALAHALRDRVEIVTEPQPQPQPTRRGRKPRGANGHTGSK